MKLPRTAKTAGLQCLFQPSNFPLYGSELGPEWGTIVNWVLVASFKHPFQLLAQLAESRSDCLQHVCIHVRGGRFLGNLADRKGDTSIKSDTFRRGLNVVAHGRDFSDVGNPFPTAPMRSRARY